MKLGTCLAVLLVSLFFVSFYPTLHVEAQPRSDLDITWYTTSDSAFTALQNGQIDIIQWSLTETQKDAVEADPNLQIAAYTENGMVEFDLNNNKTIMDYNGYTNPCHVTAVRKAIAHLVDKDYIVRNVLHEFGARIDAPIGYASTTSWADLSVVTYDLNSNGIIEPSEDNYPFKYSPDEAARLLANCGFSDTDGNGYLNYPNNLATWGNAAGLDTTQMPLKICIRADHTHRLAAGRYLYRQLEGDPAVAGDSVLALSPQWATHGKVGGDFDTTDELWVQPRPVLSPIVMRDRNYHIYTGGWSFGRYPTYLYTLYHSVHTGPYGPNYVTDLAHPALDLILDKLLFAQTIADARDASKQATNYFIVNCVSIPLWSYMDYVAWRKELVGVVNMRGVGIINDYTFMNAYRANNPTAPIRLGAVRPWVKLNILYSQWYFEHALLDRVYTGLIASSPYDLDVDLPWVAQEWEIGTWFDGTTEKTKVTYYLRKDADCAQPITGAYSGMFDANDLEFSMWFNYAYDDSWHWGSFMDLHHTKTADPYTLEVYFDDLSMWFVYAPTYPLLGPHMILREQLCQIASATFTAPAVGSEVQFGGGASTTDGVVQVINATADGNPISENTDYYIRSGYDVFCHNVFCNLAVTPGANVTIYYYRGKVDGAGGIYLGSNLGYDWTDTMYAYGYYYPVSITSTTALLRKNPYFFLEAPLGEIDWRWNYIGTTKPRSGYFKIDILDVVKCTSAYGSRGDGAYNPMYMPGADIDGSDLCHMGILDLVTITGKYAQTFGKPP